MLEKNGCFSAEPRDCSYMVSPTLWSPVPSLIRRNNASALLWAQFNSLLSEPGTSAGCLLRNRAGKQILPQGIFHGSGSSPNHLDRDT